MDPLDDFLASHPQKRPCSICLNEKIAEAITRFFKKKASGETTAAFTEIYHKVIVPGFGYNGSFTTAITHIRRCLKLNTRTGKPL